MAEDLYQSRLMIGIAAALSQCSGNLHFGKLFKQLPYFCYAKAVIEFRSYINSGNLPKHFILFKQFIQ